MADELVIRCSKCLEPLPATASYFYRDRNGPHGFRSVCKACYSELPSIMRRTEERAARKANRQAVNKADDGGSALHVLISLGRPVPAAR
jgi:hypothetical protein